MITYIYDGTFAGLLTAIYHRLHQRETVDCITRACGYTPDLFTQPETIITDPDLAEKLLKTLTEKLLKPAFHDIFFCFLAEEDGIEQAIFDFIVNSLAIGADFTHNYADDSVRRIRKTSDRVSYEIHRMHGFIRFRKMSDGLYYAPIEPDHNIVELLAPHFTARFADQPWFIHDLRRHKGLYYDGAHPDARVQCRLVTGVEARPEALLNPGRLPPADSDSVPGIFEPGEPLYGILWNEYFQGIAIPERENKRLQRQHMPKRYWKHLVEQVEQ